ncbi:hypothetical protein ACP70R_012683 [Stipagrostis hirtigluma subsp. patula]
MELFHLYAACLVLAVSSLHLLRLFTGPPQPPPNPHPLPLVGNLFDLGALPHRSLECLAARHGPLMTLHLGAVTIVVASSADATRHPAAPLRRLLRALRPGRRSAGSEQYFFSERMPATIEHGEGRWTGVLRVP